MSNTTTSRFIVQNDFKIDNMIYPIPIDWWSRSYEYAWAASFALPNDIVLDAACGLPHHFKFYLSDVCMEVYACDSDNDVYNREAIRNRIRLYHGEYGVSKVDDGNYLDKINLEYGDITALQYDDRKFDKVFCLSVLEHLESESLMLSTLNEFKRVLKDDGFLVITYDYPDITPEVFSRLTKEVGLEYVGEYDASLPEDAIFSGQWYPKDLRCFRALLRKG